MKEILGPDSLNRTTAMAVWGGAEGRPRGNSSTVFLANVVEEVGPRLLTTTWTGQEPLDAIEGPPFQPREATMRPYRPPPPPPPVTLADWPRDSGRDYVSERRAYENEVANLAEFARKWDEREELRVRPLLAEHDRRVASWDRLRRVMEWIATLGEEGRLVTRGRLVLGGEYFELPASVWNIESLWQTRFRACQAVHRGLTSYIFLTRESLDGCLATLRASGPRVASRARAEGEAMTWLLDRFAEPDTANTPKGVFRQRAQQLFAGLSGEAFERAWGAASLEYPERRVAGRKSTGSVAR